MFRVRFWLNFSIINLLIVATLGTLMRYKIGFNFPFFDQSKVLHSHSHFAFSGWVTNTIYVLIVYYLMQHIPNLHFRKYSSLIAANLFCAYGMLVSFIVQGYGQVSISFSTGTIIISCIFAVFAFRDFNKTGYWPSIPWFKAALCFNIISAAGTFYLAFIMMQGHHDQRWYLAAIYFYLHFSYNGFFIFSCMGLLFFMLPSILPSYLYNKNIFRLFIGSIIPAYFLSVLWAGLPLWLYIIVVVAAFAQLAGWMILIWNIKKHHPPELI
jgi:hypothetical protein